ncbi:zinc finger protein DHHC domain-containing protein [Theileria equi strain WA]|uniref:Palmitoyltransferase n=1 Tax=Theileria equi strain WA TaxID=1537102 RepID=L0B1M6_THEEQ|nr:zinc finger protein DHHC domain-containing protein [Theileria equi strain WA]AFZ81156.1 zinc finger protein DHHC domain-containing protein [Theileria equi strain WA]|eukprot:XP_004830822.1 zinc finger protein DHHC domain-containing protein [Theileria equi strain WA]
MSDSVESITEKDTLGNKCLCFKTQIGLKRNLWSHISSIALLLFPYLLFGTTTLPWLGNFYGWTIPVVVVFLFCMSLILFFLASYTNPGILLRHHDPYNLYDHIKGGKRSSRILPQIEVVIHGKFLRIKYCYTCNMYRSPRSIHCSVCDVCVNKFDHHCKWLGNCIGSNNYLTFISFIVITFVITAMMVCFSIIRIVALSSEGGLSGILECGFLLLYILTTGWFIVGLMLYHLYLICTNQTTNEQLKSTYANYNPWNRGTRQNICDTFFSKVNIKTIYRYAPKGNQIYNPGANMYYFETDSSLEKKLKGIIEIYSMYNIDPPTYEENANSFASQSNDSNNISNASEDSHYDRLSITHTSIGTNFPGNNTKDIYGFQKYEEPNMIESIPNIKEPLEFSGDSKSNKNLPFKDEALNTSNNHERRNVVLPGDRHDYVSGAINRQGKVRKTIPDIQKESVNNKTATVYTTVNAFQTSERGIHVDSALNDPPEYKPDEHQRKQGFCCNLRM